MLSLPTISLADHGRQLSYTQVLAYSPGSQITDHLNIDLDQSALVSRLSASYDFAGAKAVYESGGHSRPEATCTLVSPSSLASDATKETPVSYITIAGDTVTSATLTGSVSAGATKVELYYPVSSDRVADPATTCWVGGLRADETATNGCIAGSNSMYIVDGSNSILNIAGVEYGATCVNVAGRTLKGFSMQAKKKMHDCVTDTTKPYANGCPYTTYEPYRNYYGDYSYADSIVAAAFDSTTTSFARGNMDFTAGPGAEDVARSEVISKATAYVSTWMYVLREFEDAIDDCTAGDLLVNTGSSGAVAAWDEGVAFFVGSQMVPEDLTGSQLPELNRKGVMAYTLGNKRCQDFRTCGPSGDEIIGEARANNKLMSLFSKGQYELLVGNCAKVVPVKDAIAAQMTVPLVQGTLRYVYNMDKLSGGPKEQAEGAIFAAAVLPQLHACSPEAAEVVHAATKLKSSIVPDFAAVKAAFEGCYVAMGITCADVGGLWLGGDAADEYYPGAAPCADASNTNIGAIIGGVVGGGVALLALLMCICCMVAKEKRGQPMFTPIMAASVDKARAKVGSPTTPTTNAV